MYVWIEVHLLGLKPLHAKVWRHSHEVYVHWIIMPHERLCSLSLLRMEPPVFLQRNEAHFAVESSFFLIGAGPGMETHREKVENGTLGFCTRNERILSAS